MATSCVVAGTSDKSFYSEPPKGPPGDDDAGDHEAGAEPTDDDAGKDEEDASGSDGTDPSDLCPQDVSKTDPGLCGCGVPDKDGDQDGVIDCQDDCPQAATVPGAPCGAVQPDKDCEYAKYGGHAYWFCSSQARTFAEARSNCQKDGMDLVIVDDAAENNFLKLTLKSGDHWIGLNDQAVETQFRWFNGGQPGFRGFASGEASANRGENCAAMRANGEWFDVGCGSSYRYVCEAPPACVVSGGSEICDGLDNDCDGTLDEDATCAVGCGGTVVGSRVYQVCGVTDTSKKKNFADARAVCAGMGATLVRVDDADENLLVNALRAGEGEIYLGASDLLSEGSWLWEDGTQFWTGTASGSAQAGLYNNWSAGGEPNGGTGENCAELRGDAKWQDNNCANTRAFACER
ncbi:MAG: C-type lectin domain-containing protein [Myxococcales bacterium]